MIKVSLVGKGNVSKHLENAFSKAKNITMIEVLSSRESALKNIQNSLDSARTDIYIIAVSDDVISTVSENFIDSNKLIVHTSGSVSMTQLSGHVRKGVFYPLQTFSKEKRVDFTSVPICIEAESNEDLELLRKLGESISESVFEISSEQRKSLHLAAVFANNFTNHLYHIGNEICKENEVPFDILKPLIAETVKKIDALPPIDSQTGPAKRNDQKTIDSHINQLKNKTHQEIYQILTKSIQETYGEKL